MSDHSPESDPTQRLHPRPLLDPLRLIPILGNPLANFLQPFLRPIIDAGYGNMFGFPALLPGFDPLSVGSYVGQGVAHGIADPLVAGLPPASFSTFSNVF